MPVNIRLRDGLKTTIKVRDQEFYADEPLEKGGGNTAPTPGELMLGALGSCIAITVKYYAERKGWDLQGVDVQVDYERFNGKDYPAHEGDDAFVHEIRKGIRFIGDLDNEQHERLYEIATKCPIHRLLSTPSYFVDVALEEELASGAD